MSGPDDARLPFTWWLVAMLTLAGLSFAGALYADWWVGWVLGGLLLILTAVLAPTARGPRP